MDTMNENKPKDEPLRRSSPQSGSVYTGPIAPPPPPPPVKRNYLPLIAVGLIVAIFAAVGLWLNYSYKRALMLQSTNKQGDAKNAAPSRAVTNSLKTPLELKITPYYQMQLRSVTWPMYIPSNQSINNIRLSHSTMQLHGDFLNYGVNTQPGKALHAGSYEYFVYPAWNTYNPPADCALPSGKTGPSPLTCPKYSGSSADLPAYVYDKRLPWDMVSDTGSQPITMYVKKGNVVIAVSTADTNPSVVYGLIKNMKRVSALDLPVDTLLIFDPPPKDYSEPSIFGR